MKTAIHFLTHLQTFSPRDNLEFLGLGLIKFFVVFSLQVIEKLSLSIIAHSLPLQNNREMHSILLPRLYYLGRGLKDVGRQHVDILTVKYLDDFLQQLT